MIININEYDKMLRDYLNEHGPNPGQGYFGSHGWYSTLKNAFDRSLKEKGIEVQGLNQNINYGD
jgi:hypothetical protein